MGCDLVIAIALLTAGVPACHYQDADGVGSKQHVLTRSDLAPAAPATDEDVGAGGISAGYCRIGLSWSCDMLFGALESGAGGRKYRSR